MNVCFPPHEFPRPPVSPQGRAVSRFGRDGFALLITITLVAFLVLMLVSFATLTRVETRVADNNQKLSTARQNALSALNIAIGQLQKYAGPDLRVTARAELQSPSRNAMFTGVWKPAAGAVPSTPETWLVSGNEDSLAVTPGNAPDPATAAGADEVFLLADGSVTQADARVKLPKQPIKVPPSQVPGLTASGSDVTIGHFAYWVGDEGVKASVGIVDQTDSLAYNNTATLPTATSPAAGDDWSGDQTKRDRLRQMGQPRPRVEKVFGVGSFDPDATGIRDALPRVIEPRQLPFVSSGLSTSVVGDRFHDFTARSEAVLVDLTTGDGRLRQDLSDTPDLTAANETAIADYLRERPDSVNGLQAVYKIRGQSDPAATTFPMFAVAPVITEFVARFQFYRSSATGKLVVRYDLQVELWNPYGASISSLDTGSDLSAGVAGLPIVDVADSLGASLGTVDLNTLVPSSIPLRRADCTWLPGQILVFWGGTELFKGDSSHPPVGADVEQLTVPADSKVTVRAVGSGALTAKLFVGTGATQTMVSTQSPLISFSKVNDLVLADDNPAAARVGFAYDVNNSLKPWTNGSSTVTSWDLRRPILKDGFTSVPGQTDVWKTDPSQNTGLINLSSSTVAFSAISAGGSVRQTVQFDLPRQEVVSVGQLQHIIGEKPYMLGTEQSGSTNNLFDRFFLSTLPRWASWSPESPPPLPNRYVRVSIDDATTAPAVGDPLGVNSTTSDYLLDRTHAAKYLMQTGAFNINSTSVAAWSAVLGGVKIAAWSYYGTGTGATAPLSNGYFRLPNGAQEMREPTYANSAMRGVKDLTDAQVTDLATRIVTAIKARGAPFPSLSSFVDSGILVAAIDASGINPAAITNKSRPAGYLMQGDVLTAIAPFITPRSDTFVIRAYGDAQNPVTSTVETKAWCEAVVQRLPELTDPVSGSYDPAVDPIQPDIARYPFGRRFKIISFRWLSESEI